MPQGLQIFDPSGNLVLDTSSYVVKTGVIDIGDVSAPGSADISAITALGGVVTPVVSNNEMTKAFPVVSISGNTLSWSRQAAGADFNARIRIAIE